MRRDRIGACLVHAVYARPEESGLLHADPHPGNVLLLPDGRVGVLDFGAVKRLPEGIPAPLGRSAELVDYLLPMSELSGRRRSPSPGRACAARPAGLADPISGQHVVAKHLHLPPST